jgi:hypothetical protein
MSATQAVIPAWLTSQAVSQVTAAAPESMSSRAGQVARRQAGPDGAAAGGTDYQIGDKL